jgi:hypothetical protein
MTFATGQLNRPKDRCRVQTPADVTFYRASVLTTLFGGALPSEVGTLSTFSNPAGTLTGVATCQKITMTSYTSRPVIWTPTAANGDAVILHNGHSGSYTNFRYTEALQTYLDAGFAVCGMVMPGGTDTVGGNSTTHEAQQRPLGEFVGPVAVAVNTLVDAGYDTVHMTGLSGGGWTTHLYAAIDPRIEKSFPIAGSLPLIYPLYLSSGFRDWEQRLPGLSIDYTELYVLAASNGLCKQILHDEDDCCFREAQYRLGWPYGDDVSDITTACGGRFELSIVSKVTHEFDPAIITAQILPEIT